MKIFKKIWKSVKRNPVLNAFALAVATQIWQDYVLGKIDWAHFFGYLFTLILGVIARFFTVPESEHREELARRYQGE